MVRSTWPNSLVAWVAMSEVTDFQQSSSKVPAKFEQR
jgi:hypothetical protein